jgi:cysteinyl-tRNA synthetase
MYNCGPTVYGTQHIGNMRAAIFADTIRRTLEFAGYKVKQVINITDFGHLSGGDVGDDNTEDKMTQGLKRDGLKPTLENMRKLAEKYTEEYFADLDLLGIDRSKIKFPRASDYIPEQVALIKSLVEKSYAYQTKEGVYYDVSRFLAYGKLGNINLAGLKEGARVESSSHKRGPLDFILWKSDPKLGWHSPWGMGFPGWHIECTAMIFKLLGKQIDIHTGGIEHIPVHHNNEIAQAEAATGKKFVGYWLHNDHITIEGKKISKSLGNTVYLHSIVEKGYSARAYRLWVLGGHYRSPMNFTWDAMEGADTSLTRLTRSYLELPEGGTPHEAFLANFFGALSEDLNTPNAIALMWDFVKGSAGYEDVSPADKKATLKIVDTVLGLGFSEPRAAAKLSVIDTNELPEEIQKLLTERKEARDNKDFAKSDELREQIESLGFILKDSPDGTSSVTQK